VLSKVSPCWEWKLALPMHRSAWTDEAAALLQRTTDVCCLCSSFAKHTLYTVFEDTTLFELVWADLEHSLLHFNCFVTDEST
jgi:hypothetical protein